MTALRSSRLVTLLPYTVVAILSVATLVPAQPPSRQAPEPQAPEPQAPEPQGQKSQPAAAVSNPFLDKAANPYRLEPFQAAFPAELEYPPMVARDFDHSRRQVLRQLANNLQGNVRREAWQLATEFFWRAPEDAIEPLIEAMDRAMANPAFADVVRNCVEAMGKMARPEFDGALRRALQHKTEAVRQGAYNALAACASKETLRRLVADFVHMNGRARQGWLNAVGERLPEDRVPLLRSVMMANYPAAVREQVLLVTLKLPAEEAAEILRGRWETAGPEFKAVIAGVLHATGDGSGTAWLRAAMTGDDLALLTAAIRNATYGDAADKTIGVLREPLLLATTHVRADIRLEAAKQLTKLSGDDVADVFEVLASPDEAWEIRALSVRELTRRGRDQLVSVLLEELPTATGTRLQSVINQLSASGDPRAVPILQNRFERSGEGKGRHFLQAIAQNASSAAAEALCTIFEGPCKVVKFSDHNPLTTRSYIPLLLLNLRGTERTVIDRFVELSKDQWELRARLMPTVVGYAMDRRHDAELRTICIDPVRAILFNPEELPQLRVQALNLLGRNWLTVDDVMRLKRLCRKEQPGMRALLNAFLNDSF